jgi:hypothetical protein
VLPSAPNPETEPHAPVRPQGRYVPLIQVASLIVTASIIWVNGISPRLHRFSWATLIGTALGYTIFACGASAAITVGLLLAVPRTERGDIVWKTLRTSAAGAWFAPAILLLSQLSPASLAGAVVLVMTTTRVLYSEWRLLHPPEAPLPVWRPANPMFGEADPPRPLFLKELMPSLIAALSAQAALAAAGMQARFLAGALAVMCTATLTIYAVSTGAAGSKKPDNLPRSILGLALTILLAAGLTVGGLRDRVFRRVRPGQGASADAGPNEPTGTAGEQRALPPPTAMMAGVADGTYPGVILQTEPQKVPKLVAPVIEMDGGFYADARRDMTIAFEGEYWMYRSMYRRPPPNSYFQKGTPAALFFHTSDRWPLNMEAHQKLDQPLDLRCCRKVQVQVWNADIFPGTVSLELLTLDSAGVRTLGLGIIPVQSVPDLRQQHVQAVMETLEFAVPRDPEPPLCNELEVVFRRAAARADKSARIAIERFVLVRK